jgi:hypothetical protein
MNDTSQDINQMHHKNWMQLELLSRKKKERRKAYIISFQGNKKGTKQEENRKSTMYLMRVCQCGGNNF